MNAGTCLFWSGGLEVGICDPGAVDSRLEQTCRGVYVDKLGSQLVSWCFEPSQQQHIKAEHKLHFISKLFISQVIIPQIMFF